MQPHQSDASEPVLGFRGTLEEAQAVWEAAARRWDRVPRRPTAGDIAAYRGLCGRKLAGRVLVLGVTPELRDLVAEAGTRPVVVDMSRAMHDATSRMLRTADPELEVWIEANWSEASLGVAEFDLVLGDMIWWTIAVPQQHLLRDRIHAALKPGGLFVGRLRVTEPARAALDPVPVVAEYLDRLDRVGADANQVEAELLYWIYDHTADHEARRLDRARTRALLLELAERPQFRRRAGFLRDAATRLIGADWTSQSREELIELLTARFALIAEVHADDYDSSHHPIVALRPDRE